MSLVLSEEQNQLLDKHLQLVLEKNATLNLTRIESEQEAKVLHIEDSLSALEEINAAPNGIYIDIGSGAGYPGIPVAVATGRKTVLLEARKNKAEFLQSVVASLGLEGQIKALHTRAEEYALKNMCKAAVVTARAVAKLSVLTELASPLLMKGGVLVCYKGTPSDEEVEHAKELEEVTGLALISNRGFELGEGAENRHVVCFEKKGKGTIRLPRHIGFAQKKPL